MWQRAAYSSIGPGRSPGFVKPDLLAFGGSAAEPFWLLGAHSQDLATGQEGTSFACPNGLRTAVGMRAHFGPQLSPLALKALMIHHSNAGNHDRREVGWGRIPNDLHSMVICEDGEAHIVFQGELGPSQWMRVQIPVPGDGLRGIVSLLATFCFATPVDPQDALNYTQAGLEVVFRPNTVDPPKRGTLTHKSAPFFQASQYYTTEAERRRDAHKWETTLKGRTSIQGRRLKNPVFDINYHSRQAGQPARRSSAIRYALIVTVASPREPDLYNRILRRYRTQLEVLRPVIEVPVRVQP